MQLQTAMLVAALGLMSVLGGNARAQVHEQTFDSYVVRANAIAAASLPERQAREHRIEATPNTGVLNVVVLRRSDEAGATVPAEVRAWITAIAGVEVPVEMRAAVANGRVSYLGTFDIPARQSDVQFRIWVRPEIETRSFEFRFEDKLAIGQRR